MWYGSGELSDAKNELLAGLFAVFCGIEQRHLEVYQHWAGHVVPVGVSVVVIGVPSMAGTCVLWGAGSGSMGPAVVDFPFVGVLACLFGVVGPVNFYPGGGASCLSGSLHCGYWA